MLWRPWPGCSERSSGGKPLPLSATVTTTESGRRRGRALTRSLADMPTWVEVPYLMAFSTNG